MINPDELDPPKAKPKPRDLTAMSIEELKNYIAEMETEITRVRETIAKKEAHRSGVEGLFKSKS